MLELILFLLFFYGFISTIWCITEYNFVNEEYVSPEVAAVILTFAFIGGITGTGIMLRWATLIWKKICK